MSHRRGIRAIVRRWIVVVSFVLGPCIEFWFGEIASWEAVGVVRNWRGVGALLLSCCRWLYVSWNRVD